MPDGIIISLLVLGGAIGLGIDGDPGKLERWLSENGAQDLGDGRYEILGWQTQIYRPFESDRMTLNIPDDAPIEVKSWCWQAALELAPELAEITHPTLDGTETTPAGA